MGWGYFNPGVCQHRIYVQFFLFKVDLREKFEPGFEIDEEFKEKFICWIIHLYNKLFFEVARVINKVALVPRPCFADTICPRSLVY